MCLYHNKEKTKKLQARMSKKHGKKRFYKIYMNRAYGLYPPWRAVDSRCKLVESIGCVRQDNGTIVSDREYQNPGRDSKDDEYGNVHFDGCYKIHRGIHVFLTKEDAESARKLMYNHNDGDLFPKNSLHILPVYASKNDLVGSGEDSFSSSKFGCGKGLDSAVFMKIQLRKADFEKAIDEIKLAD